MWKSNNQNVKFRISIKLPIENRIMCKISETIMSEMSKFNNFADYYGSTSVRLITFTEFRFIK